MSFAMNRPGRNTPRGAQRPHLLSGAASPREVDFRRLNHTASGRFGARFDAKQDNSLIDLDCKTNARSADKVTGARSGSDTGQEVDGDLDKVGRSLSACISKQSGRRISRGSFNNDYRRTSTTSMDSGVSVASADGISYGRDIRYGSDRMKGSYGGESGYSTGGMRKSLKDSGYCTDGARSTRHGESNFGESSYLADRLEDINLSSDEECPSGWWAPSPSGTERTTSQQASDIANALEERLKHEEPHVLAKRLIYKKYLQSYIPSMLSVQDKTITVVDGFAGKGRATDLGWPTEIEHYETPIIALRVALHYFKKKGKEDVAFDNEIDFDVDGYLNDIENLRMYAGDQFKIDSSDKHRVVLVFVENDKNAYIELVKNVIKIIKMYRLRVDEKEDFKHGFCKVRCDFKGTKRTKSEYLVACYIVHADFTKLAAFTGNCILVLNTQGDKRIPLDVVKRSVDSRKQVFVSLNSQIVSPDHDHSTTVNSERHTNHLTVKHLDDYERLLIQNSHTDCFLSLEMQGYTNNVTGHILFGASHMKSYKCIKESMNTVRQGLQTSLICCFTNFKDFRECDRLRLPHKFKVSDIATANAIYDRFRGTQTVMSEVEKYIWLETPYVFRKTPLKILEDNGKLIVKTDDSKRRKGTYPDFRDWNFVLR